MNFKKIVSAVSALAISVSAFVGLATTASATDTVLYSNDFTTAGIFSGGSVVTSNTNIGSVYAAPANGGFSAIFDADAENEGNQAYSTDANKSIAVSYLAYHGYYSKAQTAKVAIKNSNNVEIASYVYNVNSCQITDVQIAGSTVSGFTAFDAGSRFTDSRGANGIGGNGKPYVTTVGYNPTITFTVGGNGSVSLTFEHGSRYDSAKVFSGNLPEDVTVDVAKFEVTTTVADGDRNYVIDNFTVTEKSLAEVYTINYTVDGTVVRTVNGTGVAGDVITTDSVFDYQGTRYVGVADTAPTLTIEEGGLNVLNVPVNVLSKYTATVNAVAGSDVLKTYTSTVYEGESTRVYYNKYIEKDGVYYVTNANSGYPSYAYDFSAEDTKNVEYTVADITYYAEAENLSRSHSLAGTGGYPERYSGGSAARLYKDSYMYTDVLDATNSGYYELTIWGRNQAGSSVANVQIATKIGQTIADTGVQFVDWGKGATSTQTVTVFVPAGASIALVNTDKDWNSNLEVDYVAVKKLVPSVSATSELKTVDNVPYITFKGTVSNVSDMTTVTKAGFGFVNLADPEVSTSLSAYWTKNAVSNYEFGAAIEKDSEASKSEIWAVPYLVINGSAVFGDVIPAAFN